MRARVTWLHASAFLDLDPQFADEHLKKHQQRLDGFVFGPIGCQSVRLYHAVPLEQLVRRVTQRWRHDAQCRWRVWKLFGEAQLQQHVVQTVPVHVLVGNMNIY